ncbi:MAG: HAMP domain-containing sensor histidine kinase [Planctomycetota bacterium]
MVRTIRISLAVKCQLLFGAAVLLILSAALSVVWLRMEALVETTLRARAEGAAAEALAVPGALLAATDPASTTNPIDASIGAQGADVEAQADPPETGQARWAPRDAWLRAAGQDDDLQAEMASWADGVQIVGVGPGDAPFLRITDQGRTLWRLALPVSVAEARELGLPLRSPEFDPAELADPADTLAQDPGATEPTDAPSATEDPARPSLTDLSDPTAWGDSELGGFILVDIADERAERLRSTNRVFIVAAGLVAGLLATLTFWFITTRVVLSPVRVLRNYAQKVAAGNVHIRSDINTGDEFEQLSDVFNQMLENLKEQRDGLEAANRTLDLKLGELAETNVALFEANRLKGEFLANVSHELKTPLNAIVGFAEVLQETLEGRTGPKDERRQRYAANIISSSRRLLDLITDLLDLAKIEAGRIELNLSTVSARDTCEGLLTLSRPEAEKRDITLELKVEPKLPPLETDAGKLHQVLFNFVSNAVKFTPDGGTVTIAARLLPPGPDGGTAKVRWAISDTGPGIAPEDQARVFDKFVQLDPTVTRAHGGTGLGLTIAHDLAGLLQGAIEIESTLGHGTTFALTIPLVLEVQGPPLMPDAVGAATG